MGQYRNIVIVGAGASGCICAYFLLNAGFDVTVFDYGTPLRTLLPTGGGRCNLAHAEYDFKELAKNYPRGEKFLYSIFSKFSTYDTISFFNNIGVETYAQDNRRVFPVSNSAKFVRDKILKSINNATFVKEKVLNIVPKDNDFVLKTNKSEYLFTDVVIATGGGNCLDIGHKIISYTPALVGLTSDVNSLSGIVVKNVLSNDFQIVDDLLFTHFGISGPLAYKISSLKTRDSFPYSLSFDLCCELNDLQTFMNNNPHKDMKNIISKFLPERLSKYILGDYSELKAHQIDGKMRDLIINKIHNFKINVTSTNNGEETVTAGGYDLDEISSKTMESKIHKKLYIIGEALDIDGFCGGFNLQNAWSTAFVAAEAIINSKV